MIEYRIRDQILDMVDYRIHDRLSDERQLSYDQNFPGPNDQQHFTVCDGRAAIDGQHPVSICVLNTHDYNAV